MLLDTGVFIDAIAHEKQFLDLFSKIRGNDGVLVTIDAVLIELLKGTESNDIYQMKKKFVIDSVETFLPIVKLDYDKATQLVFKYRKVGRGVSLTDLLLGVLVKKYQGDLLLLTKNITDFPAKIYTLESYILLHHDRALHSYGIFS